MADQPAARGGIYDRTNTTLLAELVVERPDQDPDWWALLDATAQRPPNEQGSGEVLVHAEHPSASELGQRRIIRLLNGTTKVQQFVITNTELVEVTKQPVDRTLKAAGPGVLRLLQDALVLPWNDIAYKPLSDVRRFDWGSPGLPTDTWTDPLYAQSRATSAFQRPFGLAEPFSEWLWPEPEGGPHTVDDIYIDYTFTPSVEVELSLMTSADDRVSVVWDGVDLLQVQAEFPANSWWYTWRAGVVAAGVEHTLRLKVSNDSDVAAFLASGWTTDGDGLTTLAFITGTDTGNPLVGTWRCLAFPTSPPSWTAGAILRTLIDEAQARGCLTGWTIDFDDDVDSAGQPWSPISEWSCRVGSTVWDALASLGAAWIDFAAGDEGLVLRAWNKGTVGTARSTEFSVANRNLTRLVAHGSS